MAHLFIAQTLNLTNGVNTNINIDVIGSTASISSYPNNDMAVANAVQTQKHAISGITI